MIVYQDVLFLNEDRYKNCSNCKYSKKHRFFKKDRVTCEIYIGIKPFKNQGRCEFYESKNQ